MSLVVQNLTKQYDNGPLVGPVSFSTEPGEVLSVVGPNGAGKTTTLKAMLGLIHSSSGRVLYENHRLSGPQDFAAFLGGAVGLASMTGETYLSFVARMAGLADGEAAVDSALEACGIARWAKRKVKDYSSGMRQRLGIASVVMLNAPVIVLDEPFNGLDVQGRMWLRNALGHWAKVGKTIIVAAHDLDELERVAQSFLIIVEGKQRLQGSLAELTSHFPQLEYVSVTVTATMTAEGLEGVEEQNSHNIFAEELRRRGGTVVSDSDLLNTMRVYGVPSTVVFECALVARLVLSELTTVTPHLPEIVQSLIEGGEVNGDNHEREERN